MADSLYKWQIWRSMKNHKWYGRLIYLGKGVTESKIIAVTTGGSEGGYSRRIDLVHCITQIYQGLASHDLKDQIETIKDPNHGSSTAQAE